MDHYFLWLLEKSVVHSHDTMLSLYVIKAAWQDSLPLPSDDSSTHCLLCKRREKHSKGIHKKNSVLLKEKRIFKYLLYNFFHI